MDDSDDYFQDSFQLDENDLAELDALEAKYVASISQIPARAPDSLPPQKRQKVSHSYPSDEILDVFLRSDGTYGVVGVESQCDEDNVPIPESLFASGKGTIASQVSESISSHVHSSESLRERSLQRSSNAMRYGYRIATATSRQVDRASDEYLTTPQTRPSPDLHAELTSLKDTIEMLKLENEKVKSALKEAETVRLAKEGEVTMLRKKVEKATQQHADDMNKLKDAKEAASLDQARIEKDMKQQIERLRTEYIFKQHEVESSSRKAMLSTRTRGTLLGSQMSPVPIPPAMREWNTTRSTGSNKASALTDALMNNTENRGDNRSRIGTKLRPSAPEMKFPGFENSFVQSSPLSSPTRPRKLSATTRNASARTPTKSERAKASNSTPTRAKNGALSPVKLPSLNLKPQANPDFDELQGDDYIQDFDIDMGANDGSPRSRCKSLTDSSPTTDRGLDSVGDLGFSDDIDRDVGADGDVFEGINWGEELHYMLFSHMSPVSSTLTFHFLLCADVTNESYHRSCSAILEALGAKYKFAVFPHLMRTVAENLVLMADALWEQNRLRHLRALFGLIGTTMLYVPSFTEAILEAGFNDQSGDAPLLRIFSEVTMKGLDKRKDAPDQDEFSCLSHALLSFLEAIAWTVTETFYYSLATLLQSERMWLTLLDCKQPSSLICHAIDALVVLASHPSLFQPLLSSYSYSDNTGSEANKSNGTGPPRIPLLERLSSFLVDSGSSCLRTDDELFAVVNFFSLLVLQNREGRAALLGSSTCIPCLIHYLSRLSIALWEDDELVMKSSDHAKRTVRNLSHAMRLLHRLILAPSDDPKLADFDFRHKLFYVQHAMFNGLPHMFIVAIGRLSCADPPDWLGGDLQSEIEKLTEPARDLMDLFVEGPESDSVWVAYQDSDGETVTETGDEIEAQLLDIDKDD